MASARRRLTPPIERERAIDYTLEDFKLDAPKGSRLDIDISDSITDATLELSIEGASTVTITIEDPNYDVLNSDTLTKWAWGKDEVGSEKEWLRKGRAVDAKLDNIWFRLVKVSKQGTKVTLTFEERAVSWLRDKKGAKSVSLKKSTRAEFVNLLVKEVKAKGGIKTYIPELHKKQPIEKQSQKKSKTEKASDGDKGVADGASVTIGGKKADSEQKQIIDRVLSAADSHNPPDKALLALIEACIVESKFRNLSGGDRDSAGVLQLRTGLHGASTARDVEKSVSMFLTEGFTGQGGAISLAKAHPDWTAGKIAQAVQGSAFPSRYDQAKSEAQKIADEFSGGGGSQSYTKSYQFARGKNESSWDAIGRLAEEVNWRRFMRSGKLWFISEDRLFRQKPSLSISEELAGVDSIDYELDLYARTPIAEATVEARTERWTALPGMVVKVEKSGPADGRWLVSSITQSLLDKGGAAEISLRKPTPSKLEPAPETAVRSSEGAGSGEGVDAVYKKAISISDKNYPYVWGGGHSTAGEPSGGGYDCSGYVSACLAAGGMLDKPLTSGALASWGSAGEGTDMTVWANDEHTFIEFKGRNYKWADTSQQAGGPAGPHVRKGNRSTAGFTARHWSGD